MMSLSSSQDLHLSGITQFMQGSGFLDQVSSFVDSHCCMFSEEEEFTPGQHAIFLEFQSLIDKLLGNTLESLGCSLETFVQTLEDHMSSPRVISVSESLRTLDDFIVFHDNMTARNMELEKHETGEVVLNVTQVAKKKEPKVHTKESDIKRLLRETGANNGAVTTTTAATSSFTYTMLPTGPAAWEIQMACALNLLHMQNTAPESLTAMDKLTMGWAEEVAGVKDEMEHAKSKDSRRIMEHLGTHKLKVDFICCGHEANNRRSEIITGMQKLSDPAEKINHLLTAIHELRAEVQKRRGIAVGWTDGEGVDSDGLNKIYFHFKEFLNEGGDPPASVSVILGFSEDLLGGAEDWGFLVTMLGWLELEALVEDMGKKINGLLLNEERGGDSKDEEQREAVQQEEEEEEEDDELQVRTRERRAKRELVVDTGYQNTPIKLADQTRRSKHAAPLFTTLPCSRRLYVLGHWCVCGRLISRRGHCACANPSLQGEEFWEEGEGETINWIEQFDEASGYNFYYHNVTGECTWEPPAEAFVPVSLDRLGYEMVEVAEDEEGVEGADYTDWIWDDERGVWQYTGEEGESEAKAETTGETKEEGAPNTGQTVLQKVSPKKAEKPVLQRLESAAMPQPELPSPMMLSLDVNAESDVPPGASTVNTLESEGGGEGGSPTGKRVKKKKKKKKFVVRQRERLDGDAAVAPVPFYLAAGAGNMTPKQQRQMEDLLLGEISEPKDVTNPMHSRGKSSIEKKKQREKRSVEKKPKGERVVKAEAKGEGGG